MAVSLELAISAIRAGRKAEGRQLLNLLIQQNPNNDMAWLWMSSVVDTNEQRARCLYHVLAIDPESQLARRGLELLGVVVSDSRPVQIPRDSQPIRLPKAKKSKPVTNTPPDSESDQEQTGSTSSQPPETSQPGVKHQPFLLDPQTVTDELPFVPVRAPFQPKQVVKASPNVLALDVEAVEADAGKKTDSPEQPQKSAPVESDVTQELPAMAAIPAENDSLAATAEQETPVVAEATSDAAGENQQKEDQNSNQAVEPGHATITQQMPVPDPLAGANHATVTQQMPIPPSAAAATNGNKPQQQSQLSGEHAAAAPNHAQQPVETQPPLPGTRPYSPDIHTQPPTQPGHAQPLNQPGNASGAPPQGTRPSQPVLVNFPNPNFGANPNNPQGQQPGQQAPPNHASATMPMPNHPFPQSQYPSQQMPPMPNQQQYSRPPSEPVPVIQPNSMGMVPMGYYYHPSPQGMSVHSSATMMMPTMSDAEARARLAAGQSIPTASAAAMPLQNASSWPGHHDFGAHHQPGYSFEDNEDDEDNEINILAVIIFGTLSITALGGLGMLILLIITSSPPTG